MPDESGYPTEEELERLKTWNLPEQSVKELVEYIRSIWWMPDWGFHLYKQRDRYFKRTVMVLELHTGGWSGNEEIMGVLEHPIVDGKITNFFWIFYWKATIRGGHYYFEIPLSMWK